jgi:hypothetical protein
LQLTKRFEAAVRVVQWNTGNNQRGRNTGNVLEREREMQLQEAA